MPIDAEYGLSVIVKHCTKDFGSGNKLSGGVNYRSSVFNCYKIMNTKIFRGKLLRTIFGYEI